MELIIASYMYEGLYSPTMDDVAGLAGIIWGDGVVDELISYDTTEIPIHLVYLYKPSSVLKTCTFLADKT